LVSVLLQSIYLAKFYWWEAGYFWTLDIIYDRAGYYLCWGCLVWVPIFYAFPSYYFVAHPPQLSPTGEWAILVIGVAAIILNYEVDREKEIFKRTDGNCTIWGEKARYLPVEYNNEKGQVKKSKLLLSGFWGKLRHFNYTSDLMTAYSWCAVAGFQYGLVPFYCALFSTALLVHRVFRDEEKCSRKYGSYWKEYCRLVPYRMVPFLF
jgi:7-dehydrocholesterol reductase